MQPAVCGSGSGGGSSEGLLSVVACVYGCCDMYLARHQPANLVAGLHGCQMHPRVLHKLRGAWGNARAFELLMGALPGSTPLLNTHPNHSNDCHKGACRQPHLLKASAKLQTASRLC